jgi:hypothetical protein
LLQLCINKKKEANTRIINMDDCPACGTSNSLNVLFFVKDVFFISYIFECIIIKNSNWSKHLYDIIIN